MPARIFVSIASYRDAQLQPTLRDCLEQAAWPGNLVFGICNQYGPDEQLALDGLAARVRPVPYQDSRGCCWARAEIMRMYDGEDWFLQLDSHHRFTPRWDARLLHWIERSGTARPLLTTYGTVFDVGPPERRECVPYRMNFDRFAAGIPLFRPGELDGWRDLQRPARARFVSAHFLFAPGAFVADVPYDPELYFHGEEISLAVRAFTWGYDLLHPPEIILWHEYTRAYRRKHWDDHVDWHHSNRRAEDRTRDLLRGLLDGPYALGAHRTLQQYQDWAGVDLANQAVTPAAQRFEEPPPFPQG